MSFMVSRFIPRVLSCLLCLLALTFVLQPAAALAQEMPDGEVGCSCHSAETEAWQQSPHALAAQHDSSLPLATCEDCHGSYVRGHPEEGVMSLSASVDKCQTCHTSTFEQWDVSVHAQAGVQCTGCHLSHSQTLRLSDETLCQSCHREDVNDSFHLTHQVSDVACISCHPAPSANSDEEIPAPNHDFVGISGDKCIECHSESIGQERIDIKLSVGEMSPVELVTLANRVPDLTTKLRNAEVVERSMAATSVMALGLGTGMGGVLGVIFVIAIGLVIQRRAKS